MSGFEARSVGEEVAEGGFGAGDIVALLRKRGRLIAGITCVVTVGGVLIAEMLPTRYEGIATVQINSRKRSIVSVESVVSDLKADHTTIDSEVDVLRSRTIAFRVIEAERLRGDSEFQSAGLLPGWRLSRNHEGAEYQPLPVEAATLPDEVVGAFLANLKITRVRATANIEIRFTSRNAVKAARLANAVAEAYLKEQLEAKIKATTDATDVLEEKLQGLRAKVTETERLVTFYKNENKLFDAEGQLLSEKQLIRVMEHVVAAENATNEAKTKYDQIKRMVRQGDARSAIAEVLQNATIRVLKEQLARVTRNEAELLTRYGPKHPTMQKVRAEVADTQAQIASEIDQVLANLKTEYEVAQERERTLKDSLASHQAQSAVAKEAAVKLKELQREAESSRQLFETFLGRYKQTAETQTMQLPDARIIERADVPSSPSSPRRRLIEASSLALGLLLGFGLALGLELSIPGFRRTEEMEKALDVAALTPVPLVLAADGALADPLRSVRLMLAEPRSAFAEAIRSVRHEIDSRRRATRAKLILVASSLPSEGKTMIASNLAHHYAITGERTLLIDADLRSGMLTRRLLAEQRDGLRECVLRGRSATDAILHDTVAGLHFLPSFGRASTRISAAELLSSNATVHLLAELRQHFDTIIIDGPPLLPVVDARILADLADQIVFVMAWRRTPQDLARRALRNLGANAAKVVGVIVNQVDPNEAQVSFGYGAGEPRFEERVHRPAA